MVPQTLRGTGITKIYTTAADAPPTNIEIRQKINHYAVDMEKFKFRASIAQTVTSRDGPTVTQHIHEIMNWEAGSLTVMIRTHGAPGGAQPSATCTTVKFPTWLPRGGLLYLMKMTTHLCRCVGHSNNTDVFGLDFPPEHLPLPINLNMLDMHVLIAADESGLIMSENVTESFKRGATESKMDATMEFTS